MEKITPEIISEISLIVKEYFAEECDLSLQEIHDTTNIIEDLDGDSLMLLSLLEIIRRKYSLNIELKTLGKHLMRKPANTIGDVIKLTCAIVEYGDGIVDVEL